MLNESLRAQSQPQTNVAGLRVIVCQGAGCARIIYLSSDVEPSQRVAKQRARDNGWRLDVSGGYCPRCK